MLSELMAAIGAFALTVIETFGYGGVFFLMALESMIFPVPSEAVMPFAGFLVAQGKMDFLLVMLSSSLGSMAGSLASYYIGLRGGKHLIERYGKYFLLEERHLQQAEKWFEEKGEHTIFIGRFVPAVRHVISIPAGIGKMDLTRFCAYTFIGATIWNGFLMYLGLLLGQNWDVVAQYLEPLSLVAVAIVALGSVYFAYAHLVKR